MMTEFQDVSQLANRCVNRVYPQHQMVTYDMLILGICSCQADGITRPGPCIVDQEENVLPPLRDIFSTFSLE